MNLRVVTADMDVFAPEGRFDRIISIEMFEQVMNWRKLMTRVRSWLAPEGRSFMHIVAHRSGSMCSTGPIARTGSRSMSSRAG